MTGFIFPQAGWLDRDPIAYHAAVRPDQVAAIALITGERVTYQALDRLVAHATGWLNATLNAPLGERVAFLGRNSLEQLAILFACHRAGAIAQPLNWRLPGAELRTLVEDAEPRILIYDGEFGDAGREAAGNARLISTETLRAAFAAAAPAPAVSVDPHAPFILLYTSGTTGRPKGVIITRLGAFFGGYNFAIVGQVSAASVMLCDAPMFHTVGLMAVTRTAMQAGATLVISDRFLPGPTLKRLSDRALGITHYFAVPQIAQTLREHPDYLTSDLTGLTALFTGGAPMPTALIERFLDDGVTLANGYGSTEAGTVMCMPLDKALIRQRLEWAGLPSPATEIRLVRRDGANAAAGETGEIWLRGPGITAGYWNKPEETAQAFSEGWFRSGDAAVMDEAGYVRLIDRWKDMYITGGENVYPAEVESVLTALPGVAEAAVVGVPDPRWGESGCAFVVITAGAALEADAVLHHCEGKLARYKHPKMVRFVDALPRTASGKVRKDELRALV